MIKSKMIEIPIYGVSFRLSLFDNDAEFLKRFKGLSEIEGFSEYDGMVARKGNGLHMIFRVKTEKGVSYPTPGIIAHECKHLVNDTFIYISQKLSRHNDEAECYLLGWLVNRVHEYLNSTIKINIKK